MRLLFPLSGDDVFISYSRRDGAHYAAGLADKLTEKNFSCFIDKLGVKPNHDLPPDLIKKIKSCSVFVLVGTEKAAQSEFVKKEIAIFKQTGRTILPIDFDSNVGKAVWYEEIPGLAAETERDLKALETGEPSQNVVSFIEKSFNYTRRNQYTFRMFLGALILFFILTGSGVGSYLFAMNQASLANEDAAIATVEAFDAKQEADEQAIRAIKATERANQAEEQARIKGEIAQNKEAEAIAATEKADKAAKLADEQKKIADAEAERAAQATKEANKQQKRASEADARRKITELQDRRTSLVLKARDQLASSNPLGSYKLSKEALELEATNPKIGMSPSLRTVFAQAVNKGFNLKTYPYFKDVKNLSLHPNGKYIAAIGWDDTEPAGKRLKIWSIDESHHYGIPAESTAFRPGSTALEFDPRHDSIVVSHTFVKHAIPSGYDDLINVNETEIQWYSLQLEKQEKITLPIIIATCPGKDLQPFQVVQIQDIRFTKDQRYLVLAGFAEAISSSSGVNHCGNFSYRAWINLETNNFNSEKKVIHQIGGPIIGESREKIHILEDSKHLLSYSDNSVFIYNMDFGEKITIGNHNTAITGAASSPSGNVIAAIGADNQVTFFTKTDRFWKEIKYTLPVAGGVVRHVAFTSENQLAVTREQDSSVNLLTIAEKPTPMATPLPGETVSPDSADNQITDENISVEILKGHNSWINALKISENGEWLATASADKTIRMWRLYERDSREFQGSDGEISHIEFSKDGRHLISAGNDGVIRLWKFENDFRAVLSANPDNKRKEWSLTDTDWGAHSDTGNEDLKSEWGMAKSVKWSPSGEFLAAMTYDNRLTIWTKDYKFVKSFQTLRSDFYFSSDDWLVTYKPKVPSVNYWETDGFELLEVKGERRIPVITELVLKPNLFSPNGQWAEIGVNGQLILHDIRDGIDGKKLANGTFSPNGEWFATTDQSNENTLIWNLKASKTKPITIKGATDSLQERYFSPNGDYLVINSDDAINLRNRQRYTLVTHIKGIPVSGLRTISSNGEWIALTNEIDVYVYPIKGGDPKIFKGSYRVLTMTFSPDSRWIAISRLDRTVSVWSLEDDKQVFTSEFLNPVEDISFNHDGTKLAGATGQAVKIWFTATGEAKSLLEKTKDILTSNNQKF